jgi:hypothetical protein
MSSMSETWLGESNATDCVVIETAQLIIDSESDRMGKNLMNAILLSLLLRKEEEAEADEKKSSDETWCLKDSGKDSE